LSSCFSVGFPVEFVGFPVEFVGFPVEFVGFPVEFVGFQYFHYKERARAEHKNIRNI
jgi:hypothetical protein